MVAETTKEPTNMADEYVASYRFMQAVSSNSPPKAVAMAKNISSGRYQGNAVEPTTNCSDDDDEDDDDVVDSVEE